VLVGCLVRRQVRVVRGCSTTSAMELKCRPLGCVTKDKGKGREGKGREGGRGKGCKEDRKEGSQGSVR
jgi:hypothetical protein